MSQQDKAEAVLDDFINRVTVSTMGDMALRATFKSGNFHATVQKIQRQSLKKEWRRHETDFKYWRAILWHS